jgi:hypothetical protein
MSTVPAAPAVPAVRAVCAPIAFQSVTLSALTIGATERSTTESSTANFHAANFVHRFSLSNIDMIFPPVCEVPDLQIVGRIFWSITFGQVAPN